jgi:hypothetical protein
MAPSEVPEKKAFAPTKTRKSKKGGRFTRRKRSIKKWGTKTRRR